MSDVINYIFKVIHDNLCLWWTCKFWTPTAFIKKSTETHQARPLAPKWETGLMNIFNLPTLFIPEYMVLFFIQVLYELKTLFWHIKIFTIRAIKKCNEIYIYIYIYFFHTNMITTSRKRNLNEIYCNRRFKFGLYSWQNRTIKYNDTSIDSMLLHLCMNICCLF